MRSDYEVVKQINNRKMGRLCVEYMELQVIQKQKERS